MRRAVVRLRRELDTHPAELRDRRVAERELEALGEAVDSGGLDVETLRCALLRLTAALGSVSALSLALAEVRAAIALFGVTPR
ncbi:hypothetical protein G5C65_35845 [Streptomyces sp. SB3404]|uniref:Uncharacterized protein n=1 Tax=Streptomyces boncukensis TaxID=2711219 RepID=A0A6G4X7T6_9ACTN|nr:hypothetical protein [Streptomyces boncukensis]